jgi:hypothetical protein
LPQFESKEHIIIRHADECHHLYSLLDGRRGGEGHDAYPEIQALTEIAIDENIWQGNQEVVRLLA